MRESSVRAFIINFDTCNLDSVCWVAHSAIFTSKYGKNAIFPVMVPKEDDRIE